MRLLAFSFLICLLRINSYGQCGYYAKIQNILKNKSCNNIPIQQKELQDLMYKMQVNCPDEREKYSKWISTMKTDQDLKNYFCPGNNNSNQATNQQTSNNQPSPCPSTQIAKNQSQNAINEITKNQSQNAIKEITKYKDKPIEYSNSSKKEVSKFSNLNEEDKKKLIENIENSNNLGEFDENEINKILDIKEDVITKPIFDTYYYSSFTDAIYKTNEDNESNIILEDVAGYSFDVTFTITKNGYIENIRFQNEKGFGSTPKLNLKLKGNILYLSNKRLWIPATKNSVNIDDDVTIEIDVDKYIKSCHFLKNLKKDVANIEMKEKEKKKKEIDDSLMIYEIDNNNDNKSLSQKLIEIKNRLINYTESSNSSYENEKSTDERQVQADQMERDLITRLRQLVTDPNVSMRDVSRFISDNINSVREGVRGFLLREQEKMDELLLKFNEDMKN